MSAAQPLPMAHPLVPKGEQITRLGGHREAPMAKAKTAKEDTPHPTPEIHQRGARAPRRHWHRCNGRLPPVRSGGGNGASSQAQEGGEETKEGVGP